ncbi:MULTISPECIES: hypothetical protein [unclassified Rathayibacter]|uniref:hypothetical protein n=1 Tax=unclassified Rathayibacter TaxID=2609250 RepID=UPI00188C5C40|nr:MULTISPECIES: hypothetical protein [unclassified Rathayibacter]MBF4461171.1 hypothetical protein [Rathayibacter sp. VKM Ac-2879]MBF4502582.1 hypothetical protein [Rathayibacter sp. VKM Ac-2878]
MFSLFLTAAGQVALVAVLLGVGLPVLFALGVRSFAVAGGARPGSPASVPAPLLRIVGVLCFALVVAAVVLGLSIIIATGLGQAVSFEHVIPTFVPKG